MKKFLILRASVSKLYVLEKCQKMFCFNKETVSLEEIKSLSEEYLKNIHS